MSQKGKSIITVFFCFYDSRKLKLLDNLDQGEFEPTFNIGIGQVNGHRGNRLQTGLFQSAKCQSHL